jgi:hypothetical protein
MGVVHAAVTHHNVAGIFLHYLTHPEHSYHPVKAHTRAVCPSNAKGYSENPQGSQTWCNKHLGFYSAGSIESITWAVYTKDPKVVGHGATMQVVHGPFSRR